MKLSLRSIKVRLFLTCWVIFCLHFATDFVREHYLVLSIVEDFSFRLDKYVGLHADIFVTPDHGAHHGANPGASMIAAIPCFILKPVIYYLEENLRITTDYEQGKESKTAEYEDYRPSRQRFYKKVRERGLDIKFGLISGIIMVFCMAPLSALGAVVMMQMLLNLGLSKRAALYMTFVYAFGTPIFFRSAYLNQNLMVGIFTFVAFTQLFRIRQNNHNTINKKFAVAGFMGGLALLCDYTALVPILLLFGYGIVCAADATDLNNAIKKSYWYILGAIPPICLLWFYQWCSFGNPFYPGQHYMDPVDWIDIGYQGVGWPVGEIFWMLLFDYRFGLFVVSPILILFIFSPILSYYKKNVIPLRETIFILILFFSFTLFLSCIQYTRLQWVTGIRYIVPAIPFLFLLTAAVMVRIPRFLSYGISIASIAIAWAMSMVRRGVDVKDESMYAALKYIVTEGPQLPWLNTLLKMEIKYLPFLQSKSSALIFILIAACIVYFIWRIENPFINQHNV